MKTTTRRKRLSTFGTAPLVVLAAPVLDAGTVEWEGSL